MTRTKIAVIFPAVSTKELPELEIGDIAVFDPNKEPVLLTGFGWVSLEAPWRIWRRNQVSLKDIVVIYRTKGIEFHGEEVFRR